jgi:hypothetical protein
MMSLRIAVVTILKSSLAIIRTSSHFYSKQYFREIIMTDSITSETLSFLC